MPYTLERALESPLAPYALGALSALGIAWLWGSLAAPAAIHDEAAYLLQARIFASGQLSAPAHALPEFFEQYHVLVTPRLAPKYLPGHALALVPGIWLALPGLVPVILGGVAGGLVFALARQLAGAWVALLAWAIWSTSPADMLWRASYMSQTSSAALWLGASWFLLRFWRESRTRDLVWLALLVAMLGMTRPMTAIAFALPAAVVVGIRVWRRRAFAALGLAALAGSALLAIVPAWNHASLGDWRRSPYPEHSRVYFPYQKLGFGIDPTPPQRALPKDMVAYDATYKRIHGAHTLADLPETALRRLWATGRVFLGDGVWRAPLGVFLLLGLALLRGPALFGLASTASLYAAYLLYAHPTDWMIYYCEAHAFLAFAIALGLWRALVWLLDARAPLAAAAASLLALALFSALDAAQTKRVIQSSLSYHREFAKAVARIADEKAILFVRYALDHDPNFGLVENPPDYERARVWIVHDRGADNQRLLALAPERVPYLFDEASYGLYRLADAPPS